MRFRRATTSRARATLSGILVLVLVCAGGAGASAAVKEAPKVTTLPVTGISEEGAYVHGVVVLPKNANLTECEFEYGPTTAYGQTAACKYESGGNAGEHPADAFLKVGPGVSTHYRLVAAEGEGKKKQIGVGEDESFTTPGAFGVEGETAQPEITEATVHALVIPFGLSTQCSVEYIDDAGFKATGFTGASTAPCSPAVLPPSFGPRPATAQLSGLHTDTIYHYRFLATHSGGQSVTGAEESFATAGISDFSVQALDEEGHPVTQAGAHPYKLVTNFEFPNGIEQEGREAVDANPKDISVALPPGLIGNVNGIPKCTAGELNFEQCTYGEQVGEVQVRTDAENYRLPLYNVVPPSGYVAAFGFRIPNIISSFIDFRVRTGGDYAVIAESLNISAKAGIEGVTTTVRSSLVPLTLPTSCSGPLTASMSVDFWQAPGEFFNATATLRATTGCESLTFSPSISIVPTEPAADSPSGLDTEVAMPDKESEIEMPDEEASGDVVESTLKDSTVTLPAGLSLSPSAANGLEACSQEQFGLQTSSAPSCPDASKVGSVQIRTPLLADPLEGSVYVAQQDQNPFGSVLAIYLAAEGDGALVKLAGHVTANPSTGQLTTTFDETPELPFSSLKLDLWSGPRAAVVTPEACGSYSSEASFEAWARVTPVSASSPFEISSGCASGFSPSFTAGTTGSQAGSYVPFTLSFSRADGEQEPSAVTVNMPPGLLANISSVPECPEAQVPRGTALKPHGSGVCRPRLVPAPTRSLTPGPPI